MIKLTFCLHRLPSLTREAFQLYWFERHAPLVRKHSEFLRIRRYVQVHSLSIGANEALAASRGAPGMYDGVAELWWDSLEDFHLGAASADGRAANRELLEDERKFIDLARSPLFVGEERPVVG